MWLVVCSGADTPALWAFERLRESAPAEVALVLVESLEGPSARWRHTVGAAGAAVDVDLADGRHISSASVEAVLNRVFAPPLRSAVQAHPDDRLYAQSELAAFAVSWLTALSAVVVNPATPQGLCGRWRRPLEWRVHAARAGFATVAMTLDSRAASQSWDDALASTMILSIAGEVFAEDVPPALRESARALSASTATPILGLRFVGSDPAADGWRLLDATPVPDLSSAGEAGIAGLVEALAA
jgi:hypothetical protein